MSDSFDLETYSESKNKALSHKVKKKCRRRYGRWTHRRHRNNKRRIRHEWKASPLLERRRIDDRINTSLIQSFYDGNGDFSPCDVWWDYQCQDMPSSEFEEDTVAMDDTCVVALSWHVTRKSKKRRRRRAHNKNWKKANHFDTYWKSAQDFAQSLSRVKQRKVPPKTVSKKPKRRNDFHTSNNYQKMVHNFPKLRAVPPPTTIRSMIRGTYPKAEFVMETLWTHSVMARFSRAIVGKSPYLPVAYHGTSNANNSSIRRIGLVPGGTRGVSIANGSAYGRGVYCSPNLETASCYSRGSIFVCVVNYGKCRHSGSIWVAPSENDILPVYLITPLNEFGGGWNRVLAKGWYGLRNQVVALLVDWNKLNAPMKHRKVQRRWPSSRSY